MHHNDLLQIILTKCESQIAPDPTADPSKNDWNIIGRHGFAQEILALFQQAGSATAVLDVPRIESLKRDRPIVFLDLETSSKEISQAAIIEMVAIKIHPDGRREEMGALMNPGFDISEEITEITGITNADLEGCLPFSRYAHGIFDFVVGCYICGYGARNFDVPVLWEEMNRVGIPWNVQQDDILDPMEVFFLMEQRTLAAATRFYLGREHTDAHRALPDVLATIDVLGAQVARYDILPKSVSGLIQATRRDRRVDMAGKFVEDEQGVVRFNFGKHGPQNGSPGAPCKSQRGYLRWMIDDGDFPAHTKMVAARILGI